CSSLKIASVCPSCSTIREWLGVSLLEDPQRFSTAVPASEQMNLVKKLRERTCAPIKDVKASLVCCDRDIGLLISF
uniref:Uncharacterized protein n=1 Tax=Aegilops tauschii subsp. strangulata TaxID=200361 RepID=A0A453JFB4_AEGTS